MSNEGKAKEEVTQLVDMKDGSEGTPKVTKRLRAKEEMTKMADVQEQSEGKKKKSKNKTKTTKKTERQRPDQPDQPKKKKEKTKQKGFFQDLIQKVSGTKSKDTKPRKVGTRVSTDAVSPRVISPKEGTPRDSTTPKEKRAHTPKDTQRDSPKDVPSAPKDKEKEKEKDKEKEKEKDAPKEGADDKDLENGEVYKQFVECIFQIEKTQTLNKYFQSNISKINPKSATHVSSATDRLRNRNPDIFCIETSRVKIKEKDRDYIHANYVKFEGIKRSYIATQHPLSNTLDDFWNMVFNDEVEVVISLTNIVGTTDEFMQFYPKEKDAYSNFGAYFVTCKNVKTPKYKYSPTEYKLEVLPNGCSQSLFVTVFEYPSWGKYLVPASPKVVISIIKPIVKIIKGNSPIVVQCETGVNQSAVFILVDAVLQHLADNTIPNPETLIQEFRNQRGSVLTQRIQFLSAIHIALYFIKSRIKSVKSYADTLKQIETIETALIAEISNAMSTEAHNSKVESPSFSKL